MIDTTIDQAPVEVPIACLLTDADLRLRGDNVVQPLLEARQETRELPDGYALRFPGDEEWASRLLAFIAGERACCPFFTFELIFEPQQGPLWLRLRGPEGTKEFMAPMLAQVPEQQTPAGSGCECPVCSA